MNIVVYGAGYWGNDFVNKYLNTWKFGEEHPILSILDKDVEKQGKSICGVVINDPETLSQLSYDVVIIASKNYFSEINKELIEKYRIKEEVIFRFDDILFKGMNLGGIAWKTDGEFLRLKKVQEEKTLVCRNELESFFFYEDHKLITKWLHYFEIYERYFHKFRGKEVTVLEIGVFQGGSLQMWKKYFGSKAHIIGIDINKECKKYEDNQISIRIGSQEDRDFLKEIAVEFPSIDVLIDDGGHTMNQQIVTFEELFKCVSDEGIYLCEDLHTSYMEEYGGAYKGKTFIEYSKDFIDYLNSWYFHDSRINNNEYSKCMKALHYYDSMLVIEKKQMGPAISVDVNTSIL